MRTNDVSQALAQLAFTARFLTEALGAVEPELWDLRLPGVDFSLREQCCHLRDVELEGYLVRIIRMRTETSPLLADVDGGRLARERRYEGQDPRMATEDFTALRTLTLARLRELPLRDWDRRGRFEAGGELDISDLVERMLAHDREHRDEIAALIAAARQQHPRS